jgi:hypothetical protein
MVASTTTGARVVARWLALAALCVIALRYGSARADDAGPAPLADLAPIDAGVLAAPPPRTIDAGALAAPPPRTIDARASDGPPPMIDARAIAAPPPMIDAGVIDAPVIDARAIDARAIDARMIDAPPPRIDAGALDASPPMADAGALAAPPYALDAGALTDAPAPTVDAGTTIAPPAPAPTGGNRAGAVIKLVLGLAAVFVLAYIGGHRKVVALERRLGVSGVITAGFPMIALGLVLRQPAIGILTDDVLGRLQPILHFGLGWLGFIIGAQLDIRVLDRVPRGTAYLVVVEALGPFVVTAAACAALAITLHLGDWHHRELWRDLIILGTAAAMTAPRRFRGFARHAWREGKGVDHLIAQLDEIFGVVGLLFIAAFFRPDSGSWEIPGTAWVFVTIGLGVVVGVLFFTMIRVPASSGELLAIVLGSVAFGSGLAGYLDLSPTVVCFVAGALVINFPAERTRDVFAILSHLERPIHLLFLVLAGASWDAAATAPWLLVPAFALARIAGKWAAATFAERSLDVRLPDGFADQRTLVSPLSPLAIALVLSVQGSAGGDPSPWVLTVVIGGALLTEVAVQLTAPPVPRAVTAPLGVVPPPPVVSAADDDDDDDDDDDEAGDVAAPIYRDDEPDDDPDDGPPPSPAGGTP